MRQVGVGLVLLAAMLVLLAASGLVSGGSSRPQADPLETPRVFLPYIEKAESPTQEPVVPDVEILHINPLGPDEDISIDNRGEEPIDMTGWRLHSVVGDQWYDFRPGYMLWTRVYLRSGPDADCGGLIPSGIHIVTPDCIVWTLEYIWDDSGDKAVLYDDAGQVVDEYCYGTACP